MIDTTCTCRTGTDKVKEKRRATEDNSVRGHAARKYQKKLGDLEFGPRLGQASMLVVDDEPSARSFPVRKLDARLHHARAATLAACTER